MAALNSFMQTWRAQCLHKWIKHSHLQRVGSFIYSLASVWPVIYNTFLIVIKFHVESQTNNELIVLQVFMYVSKVWYILFPSVI